MEQLVYRAMKPDEAQKVCNLVRQVFDKKIRREFGQEGVDEFFRFANASAMQDRIQSGGFVLVAWSSDEPVGMLEFVPPDRIAMLFVLLEGKGIAKELLAQAVTKARSENPDMDKLTVHASRYAEPIYRKLGFRPAGGMRTECGISYIPMERIVQV